MRVCVAYMFRYLCVRARTRMSTVTLASPPPTPQATADASFLRVVTRPHWMLALNQIVTTSLDPQRRSATMQLISDWSAATHPPNCEFAKPFKDMVEVRDLRLCFHA